jgi:hypothetical protein
MKFNEFFLAGLALGVSACGQNREPRAQSNDTAAPAPTTPCTPPAATNSGAPAPEPSLPEPKGPIDPKSVEAAGQVVQHFGALIEQHRFADAGKLWGDAQAASAFTKQLHPETHVEIGQPGEAEGAAGSIYTTVPIVFYGDSFRRSANATLRRVNDIPGSTEAERRWHIERIDWTD